MAAARLEPGQGADGALRLLLSGRVDFDNTPALLEESMSMLGGSGTVTVDLSGVTSVNSAGLALLLEWKHLLGKEGRELVLVNVPQTLRNIARVNELETILALAG